MASYHACMDCQQLYSCAVCEQGGEEVKRKQGLTRIYYRLHGTESLSSCYNTIQMNLIRIYSEDIVRYTPLSFDDPFLTRKATAFTMEYSPSEGCDIVTYYTDDSIPSYALHPLEVMYNQWKGQG